MRRRECYHNSCMANPQIKKTTLRVTRDEDSKSCITVDSSISTYAGELLTSLPSTECEI
jgi:hypothetical protein